MQLYVGLILLGLFLLVLDSNQRIKRLADLVRSTLQGYDVRFPVFSKEQIDGAMAKCKQLSQQCEDIQETFFAAKKAWEERKDSETGSQLLSAVRRYKEIQREWGDEGRHVDYMIEGNFAVINSKRMIAEVRTAFQGSIASQFDAIKKEEEEIDEFARSIARQLTASRTDAAEGAYPPG